MIFSHTRLLLRHAPHPENPGRRAGSRVPLLGRSASSGAPRSSASPWAARRPPYEALEAEDFDACLLALRLPDGNGLDLLPKLRDGQPTLSMVVMTAYSSIPSALEAMRRGAVDYLSKPFPADHLRLTLRKVLETGDLRRRLDHLERQQSQQTGVDAIIGVAPSTVALREQIRIIAASPADTILIQGPTGTGKDLIARALHYASPLAQRPLVNINCSAIPDALLESELFGHERGAFTDASARKHGLFEVASGGSAFLDEVAELGPGMQAKLLRFLEDRRMRRLGGTREFHVDVRVIAATNVDLRRAVAEGRFRDDLYYRLRVVPITVPSLAERRDDVPLLARHFVDEFNKRFRRKVEAIDDDAMRALVAYAWPGNVRELKNLIERVMLLNDVPVIERRMLRLPESPAPGRVDGGHGGRARPLDARRGARRDRARPRALRREPEPLGPVPRHLARHAAPEDARVRRPGVVPRRRDGPRARGRARGRDDGLTRGGGPRRGRPRRARNALVRSVPCALLGDAGEPHDVVDDRPVVAGLDEEVLLVLALVVLLDEHAHLAERGIVRDDGELLLLAGVLRRVARGRLLRPEEALVEAAERLVAVAARQLDLGLHPEVVHLRLHGRAVEARS